MTIVYFDYVQRSCSSLYRLPRFINCPTYITYITLLVVQARIDDDEMIMLQTCCCVCSVWYGEFSTPTSFRKVACDINEYNVSSVQLLCAHSSSVVVITRPPSSSSLRITNHSFWCASLCLTNQFPASFHQPRPNHSFSHSSRPNHLSSSLPSSPLSPSIIIPAVLLYTQSLTFSEILPTLPIRLPSRT